MRSEIVELSGAGDVGKCADMMMGTSPWNRLYFTRAQCIASLNDTQMRIHGIRTAGGLIGFIASLAGGLGGEPLIEYLCVAETARGQGIGTRLVKFFETVLYADADNMYLFVSDINPGAIRLYVRLGYQQVGAFINFNLESQTEFLYRKTRRPRQTRFVT